MAAAGPRNSHERDGVHDSSASADTKLTPPGATPTTDVLDAAAGGFPDPWRCARLCGDGRSRPQFSRRARHFGAGLSLSRAARGLARRGAALRCARDQARRPHCADRRNRRRIRRRFLRRGLCRGVAGAVALADQLRRARILCRSIGRPARKLRPAYCSSTRANWPRCAVPRPSAVRSRRATGKAWTRSHPPAATCPAPRPTISPTSNIRAARPASRTASRSPTRRCLKTFARTASGSSSRTATAACRGCPGITTWGWSAACCRRCRSRCRSIISRPRISRAARSPGSTSSAAIRAPPPAIRRPSATTFARGG